MNTLYSCVFRGERHVGYGPPHAPELTLYPWGTDDLAARLLAASGDVSALTGGRPAVTAPAGEVRFLPPLLPASPGDAMVSGFMATHNVKADTAPPSQPNWFFKGGADVLKVHGEPLRVPGGPLAVTEEAEVVLVYANDPAGTPRYAGYTFGNDLTDIGRFKRHAGHLSYAKLCDTGVAPWLFLDAPPEHVTGETTITRGGTRVWQGPFTTGAKALYYELPAMVEELFSYPALRRPGVVHYLYLGADRSSFHGGFEMADGDEIGLDFATHAVTLAHPVRWS